MNKNKQLVYIRAIARLIPVFCVLSFSNTLCADDTRLAIPGITDATFLSRLQHAIHETTQLWMKSENADVSELLGDPVSEKQQARNADFAQFIYVISELQCSDGGVYFHDDESNDNEILPPLWGAKEYTLFCRHRDALLYYWGMHMFSLQLKVPPAVIGAVMDVQMIKSLRHFVDSVRAYDPQISLPELIQAGRNYGTASGLQKIFSLPVMYQDGVLGYSMLYPYTDNVLDDESLRGIEKKLFVGKFFKMLMGGSFTSMAVHEQKVFDMVRKVYDQFPIAHYPQVHHAMLSIFEGQKQSMAQQDKSLSAQEIFNISLLKGGTSVLADAVLVYPELGAREFLFATQLGFLLQLVDDIEDMQSDYSQGQRTLFSTLSDARQEADALTERLLYFTSLVVETIDQFDLEYPTAMKDSMFATIRLLVFQSMAKQSDAYTSDILQRWEHFSPLDFSVMARLDFEHQLFNFNQQLEVEKIEHLVNRPIPQPLRETMSRLTRHLH